MFDRVAGRTGGAAWWRRPRSWLRRPTGIRNGGLLLVLVALAAVMALVDKPPEPGVGGRLPGGISQHLPPPAGILGLPPVTGEPSVPPAGERLGALGDDGERPASSARAHPRRRHPRPDRAGSSGDLKGDAVARPAGGGGGGQGGAGAPVAATPAARVRVPPVGIRVRPPDVLGRDLPDAEVETPAASVSATAGQAPRVGLG
jgi:hypothetical protein